MNTEALVKAGVILGAVILLILGGTKIMDSFSPSGNAVQETPDAEGQAGEREASPRDQGGEAKEYDIEAFQFGFDPEEIVVNQGDRVKLRITSTDVAHGFGLPAFGISERLEPGKTVEVEFTADRTGTFPFACTVYCGPGHGGMTGKLIVKG